MRVRLLLATLTAGVVGCEESQTQDPQDPMGTEVDILFLHHSTGERVWDGGVAEWFADYNTANATTHVITEEAFPDSPYPWANYPYDYWYLWVANAGPNLVQGQATLEILTAQHDVIVFKHCFPVSRVQPDTGSPDVGSEEKTRENYELQYEALKRKLLEFSSTRFIVWTGAALTQDETNPDEAQRARGFFDWVKSTWDEPGDNIYVWDFWQLETEGGLYLLNNYAQSPTNSHPAPAFAQTAAPLFARRVVDVINGNGDLNSLTGE